MKLFNHRSISTKLSILVAVIPLPTAPQPVGINSSSESLRTKKHVADFIEKANKGDGFTQWYWEKPGKKGSFLKQGYVAPIPGTDLLLITAVYIDDVQKERAAAAAAFEHFLKKSSRQSIAVVVVVFLIVLLPFLYFLRSRVIAPSKRSFQLPGRLPTGITKSVLAGETLKPMETVRYRKDGSKVNVIATGSPIYTDGELKGVVAVYTDISELKQKAEALRESKQRLELALKSADLGLWDWNVQTGESLYSVKLSHYMENKQWPILWEPWTKAQPATGLSFLITADKSSLSTRKSMDSFFRGRAG
jgi:PAS domain-containing protein